MSPAVPGARSRALFVVLMLGLLVLFIALGSWQVARLTEKEALIATVAERLDDPPTALPPAAEWPSLDPADYDFMPLSVTGSFVADATVPVFTSLSGTRGIHSGPGYWLMTPFALDDGGTVFVNRGFIPQVRLADLASFEPATPAAGSLTLTGIGRRAEQVNSFTPRPDEARGIEWVRDPRRLAALSTTTPPVAPLYLDLPAGAEGDLPQGGETVVEFPNNHLGYAITWFGFAIITPFLLFFWLRRPRARKDP